MQFHGDPEMFGDPADFAIEAGVETHLVAPSSVWGHMRVWCGGHALGNIEDRHCALYPSYLEFDRMGTHLEDLWDEELRSLDDRAMWNFLDGALYGYHGDVEIEDDRSLEEVRRDAQRFGKFNFLTNWGEQFDGGYKSFVVCPSNKPLRVLSRAFPESVGLGVNVSRTGFARASRAFVDWFTSQELRLSGGTAQPAVAADRAGVPVLVNRTVARCPPGR
jgi:hypothetical protein